MIEVKFRKPNFRAKVREKTRPNSSPKFRLLYADDITAARTHLSHFGFDVLALKPYNFKTWVDKAIIAKDTALQEYPLARKAGKSYEFNSDLWGQLKEHLQDLFQGRCAYCEAWFQSVSYGDVEHYRPKAEVTDDPQHPGYYWLAYDPENYLPACSQCNTGGKGNHFPVEGARVAIPGANLDTEKPLLFNPYWDRQCDHVAYVPAIYTNHPTLVAGCAVAKTQRGTQSIECYALNRQPLIRARLRAQKDAVLRLQTALFNRNKVGLEEILRGCLLGKEEYCTAAATEINAYYKDMGLPSPFPPEITLGV
jgi:hypothetical protein